jgi:hypothetical protein
VKIDVLKIDDMTPATQAWRLSRDPDKLADWREVCRIDAPVTEMPSALCYFSGFTILEREVIASSRTHVMWARTSYVDDPLAYRLPEDLWALTKKRYHHETWEKMAAAKKSGDSQDDWRRLLPVGSETAFTMRLSYRDAVKYALYFDYLRAVGGKKLPRRFGSASSSLYDLAKKFLPRDYEGDFLGMDMTMPKLLNERPMTPIASSSISIVDAYQIVVATLTVPLWLRAHFVRHRPITFVDDLFQLLKRDDVLELSIAEPLTIQVAASRDVWAALLGKRSCWIAGSTLSREKDPWQAIADEFGDQVLPCADGTCPYRGDAMARVEGTYDRGAPCPRFIRLEGIDPTPHLDRIAAGAVSRGSRWQKEIALMMEGR